MFGKDTLVIPDGTYELSEQRFEVDKIVDPNGKRLSLQFMQSNDKYKLLLGVWSDQEYILTAQINVISREKKGLGIIRVDTDIKVPLDYRINVEPKICDMVSGVLPMASGYRGSSWLGTVIESRIGDLENAMSQAGFDLIVPTKHYMEGYVIMARCIPAGNDPELQLRLAEAYVNFYGHPGVRKKISEYFDPIIRKRKEPSPMDLVDTSKLPDLTQIANKTSPIKTATTPNF